jgi:hypothetical protein
VGKENRVKDMLLVAFGASILTFGITSAIEKGDIIVLIVVGIFAVAFVLTVYALTKRRGGDQSE